MIEISNLTTTPIDEEFLKKIVNIVLEKENKREANLSIVLVGPGRIRQINKKYWGKNRVIDVLTFPESKVLLEKFKIWPIQKVPSLGEIIICLREVKKNAKRHNLTFERELARVLIHGILHLLKYDHEKSPEKAAEMEKKQEYYLSQLF